MKPVFSVILWNDEKPNFNHTLIFPAYPYALEDILEKVQAKNEASLHWEINDTVFDLEYLLPISEESGSMRELNALARKLSELDRAQQIGFLGLLKLEQGTLDAPPPLSRIIDLAYGTQCCQVTPELRSEVELAYHCVEEGLIPEFKDLTQEQLRLINYPLLGEKQRKAEGGVFVQSKSSGMSGYVRQIAPIGHTSLDLTPERPKYAMLLSISNKWSSGARRSKEALLELPMAEDALTSILAEYDGLGDDGEVWDRIAWRGRDCVVPQLTDMLFDYGSDRGYTESAMRYLNYLAGKLSRVKPEILPAYKALLSAMDCRDLSTADRLLDAVDSYNLSPQINNPADMVEDTLNKRSGQDISLLISHVNMDRYGETLIEESGGELTPYGLLTRRNGQPVKDIRNQPEQLGWQSGMMF